MDFGTRVKQLRESAGMSRDDLAKRLGVSYWTVSKYETNDRFPDQDTLLKIADVFDVALDHLLNRTRVVHCKECGFSYESPIDDDEHRKHHNKVVSIRERYGFYYTPYEQEQIKKQADKILNSDSTTKPEKVSVAEELLKAYFSRDLLMEDFRETSFSEWALKDLRSENSILKNFPASVREALIEKYKSEVETRELPQTVAPYLPEGFEELSPEAKKEVLDYIDYIMVKYAKKEDK